MISYRSLPLKKRYLISAAVSYEDNNRHHQSDPLDLAVERRYNNDAGESGTYNFHSRVQSREGNNTLGE